MLDDEAILTNQSHSGIHPYSGRKCPTNHDNLISFSCRHASKEALMALGEEGRNLYFQAQLSSHGFQGLALP